MATDLRKQLLPGVRVRVTQQIAARKYSMQAIIEGTIVSYGQRPTGSWYAHSRDDRLWLDRVEVRKADGEITVLNLDDYSDIKILGPAPAAAPTLAAADTPPSRKTDTPTPSIGS